MGRGRLSRIDATFFRKGRGSCKVSKSDQGRVARLGKGCQPIKLKVTSYLDGPTSKHRKRLGAEEIYKLHNVSLSLRSQVLDS